jgi:hypothetical protein
MSIRRTLAAWRESYRRHRIREREANAAARAAVQEADAAVGLAGHKRFSSGPGAI